MIAGVADTHAALWYIFKNPSLPFAARNFMENAASRGLDIAISSISLVEIVYLLEKGRLPFSAYTDLKGALSDPDHVLVETPLTGEVVEAMRQVSRAEVPDMPDRIVAATAIYLRVPVISGDGRILASNVRCVW